MGYRRYKSKTEALQLFGVKLSQHQTERKIAMGQAPAQYKIEIDQLSDGSWQVTLLGRRFRKTAFAKSAEQASDEAERMLAERKAETNAR